MLKIKKLRVRSDWTRMDRTLEPPGGMQRHHASGEQAEAGAAESRRRDHVSESLRARKAAERLDEVAVGFGIARHRTAERRNDVEGVEIVKPVEPGHVDGRKFEAEK